MKIKILLSICFGLFFTSCNNFNEKEPTKTTILVSLPPHKALVEKIIDHDFTVETVVPIGSNPHVFEPTPRQVLKISKAKIWFQIGESFEKKLHPVLAQKNNLLVTKDLKADIPLLRGSCCHHHHSHEEHDHHHSHEHSEDKHIWTSPKLLKIQARTIADFLQEQFPEKKEIFAKNLQIILNDLDNLDAKVENTLHNVKNRSILVSHPAFAYFCKDYQIEQISVEYEGKEPTISYLNTVIEKILNLQTKIAISMPQHSNKGLEIIAQKNNLHLCQIDPYDENFENTISCLAELFANE